MEGWTPAAPTADPVPTANPAPKAVPAPTVEPAEDFKRKRNGSSKHRHFDRIQLDKVIQVKWSRRSWMSRMKNSHPIQEVNNEL